MTPQTSVSWRWSGARYSEAVASAETTSAPTSSRIGPKRLISRPLNGPPRPYIRMLTAMANEIADRLQPNSSSSGLITRPGMLRTPADGQQDQEDDEDDQPAVVDAES